MLKRTHDLHASAGRDKGGESKTEGPFADMVSQQNSNVVSLS